MFGCAPDLSLRASFVCPSAVYFWHACVADALLDELFFERCIDKRDDGSDRRERIQLAALNELPQRLSRLTRATTFDMPTTTHHNRLHAATVGSDYLDRNVWTGRNVATHSRARLDLGSSSLEASYRCSATIRRDVERRRIIGRIGRVSSLPNRACVISYARLSSGAAASGRCLAPPSGNSSCSLPGP